MSGVANQPHHAVLPKPALNVPLRAYRYPLAVWAASRLAVYLLIAMQGWTNRTPRQSGASYSAFFSSLGNWDAVWYRWIAQYWYDPSVGHGNTAAFFPLYPAAWWTLSWLPGPLTLWGSIISSVFFAAALCLLYRMTLGRYDERMAQRTVLYLAIFPLSFVFSLPYAESLFLLCALACFALTWHGHRWWGAAAGALAVLARPVGIGLVPALAWRTWKQDRWRWQAYLPILLLPAAELAFFGFLWWRTGDSRALFHAQVRGWGRGVSILPVVFVQALGQAVLNGHLRYLVHAAFTVLWCGLFYKAWKMKIPAEYLIFCAALVILPTTGGLLVSMGRFGMVGFPFFWALADLGRSERVDTLVKTVSPMLLAALIFITYGPRTFTP